MARTPSTRARRPPKSFPELSPPPLQPPRNRFPPRARDSQTASHSRTVVIDPSPSSSDSTSAFNSNSLPLNGTEHHWARSGDIPLDPALPSLIDTSADSTLIHVDTPSTLHAALSPDDASSPIHLDPDEQLVNDHNHVGPGHDMMARPYVCKFGDCDKAFARKSDLARHFRIHTNDRPFVCQYPRCGKSFIQRSALTVHTRVHTGEKPHLCELCRKPFADSSSLARHRRIHTGKRPYTCKVQGCGRSFARRNTYLKHHKRQHPNLPTPSSQATHSRAPASLPFFNPRPATFYAPGPPGPDGQPQYYVPTPSTTGPPHAIAASYPSESAAYIGGGFSAPHYVVPIFGGNDTGITGDIVAGGHRQHLAVSTQNLLGHGQGQGQSQGIGGGISPGISLSPAPHDDLSAAGANVTGTPVPTGGSGGVLHTPATPSSGDRLRAASAGGPQAGPLSASANVQSVNGPAGYHFGPPQYAAPPLTGIANQNYSFSRMQSTGGGVIYVKNDQALRSVSYAHDGRTAPYTSASSSWVGGGFSASQLSIPPNHHMHLQPPSYFPPPPNFSQPSLANDNFPSRSPASGGSREGSPDLVDINSVPSFSFQPAHGPPMRVPFTAVEPQPPHFHPLTHAPPQLTIPGPQPPGLRSAPPSLQRFHSVPNLPTLSGWDVAPYAGPGGYGDAHSIGGGRSGEDEELEELGEQIFSRDASSAVEDGDEDDDATALDKSVNLAGPPKLSQWGPPIDYPSNPKAKRDSFPSGASSSSTASTLVAQPLTALPTMDGSHAQEFVQPYVSPLHPTSFYPTPITPATGWLPPFKEGLLSSPSDLLARPYNAVDSPMTDMHDPVQHITLTTPPKLGRKDRSVTAVGLGIANVKFDDHDDGLGEDMSPAQDRSGALDGEDEMDSELDVGEMEDEADEEFLPGRKKRPSSTKKVSGRRSSTKSAMATGVKAKRR